MNILYVSHLTAKAESGPTWSVPASVKAQSKFDNVLWVNTFYDVMPNWKELECFYWLKDKPLKLKNIPEPFNKPDIVVFEGLYDSFREIFFAKELRKNGIPYIVIPRGSLTYMAMHNKSRWKKEIAHFLFYDKFIKKASAIQYLTKAEHKDSKYRFDGPYFIIPNGFTPPTNIKSHFGKDTINAVFIGRFDIYHKGLDLLIEACKKQQDFLRDSHFVLTLYGTQTKDWYTLRDLIEQLELNNIIKLNGPVNGKEKEIVLLNSDLFVMASRWEGHPMGLIEALAYGLPCLVTPGTNMADEIESANAGWVCQGNVESIRETICSIINQKESLPVKGEHARVLSLQYDWTYLANNFHNEILKII